VLESRKLKKHHHWTPTEDEYENDDEHDSERYDA
jgi:hypothetical protein